MPEGGEFPARTVKFFSRSWLLGECDLACRTLRGALIDQAVADGAVWCLETRVGRAIVQWYVLSAQRQARFAGGEGHDC